MFIVFKDNNLKWKRNHSQENKLLKSSMQIIRNGA